MPLREIAVFVVLVLAAQGLGQPLVRRFRLGEGAFGLVWSQALGLAGLVALAWLLSLLGLLRPWPAGLILAVAAGRGVWEWPRSRPAWLWPVPSLNGWEKLFLAGIVFYNLLGLFQALAPPTWGEGVHYLFVMAGDYGQAGRVYYHPDLYASRPQNMVLLFSLAQLFARAEASQLISWWFGCLSIISLAAVGSRLADRTTGLLAGLIVSAMPLFGQLTGRGMSDLGVFFYGILGLSTLWLAFHGRRRLTWAVLAGLCLGLGAGFKSIGLGLILFGGLAAILEAIRLRRGLAALIILGGICLLAASPWYVYSYLHTGHLVYDRQKLHWGPLSAGDQAALFGPVAAQPERGGSAPDIVAQTTESQPGPIRDQLYEAPGDRGPWAGWWHRNWFIFSKRLASGRANPLLAAWNLNLITGRNQRVVGPFVLALAPLLLLIRPLPPPLVWLTLVGAAYFCLGPLLLGNYVRYVLVGLALAALGAAYAWRRLLGFSAWSRLLAVLCLAVCWAPLWPVEAYRVADVAPAALGLTDRREYLDRVWPEAMAVYDWANAHLPPEARVLFIAEYRPYYLKRAFIYGLPWRNPYLPYSFYRDSRAAAEKLRQMGVSHVLLNRAVSDNAWDPRRHPDDFEEYRSWVDRFAQEELEPLFSRGELTAYRLK